MNVIFAEALLALRLCVRFSFDFRQSLAGRITGVGRKPQANHGLIFFIGAAQELRQSCRATNQHNQDAGRERIQGAGMADAALAGYLSDTRDHIV